MVPKSVLCLNKNHSDCITDGCECNCHHDNTCECFACKIRSLSFGDVPGGYKSVSGDSKVNKYEDF
jgi:hypothetical protein